MWIKERLRNAASCGLRIRDIEHSTRPTSTRVWRPVDVRSWGQRHGADKSFAWVRGRPRFRFEAKCLAIGAAAAGRSGRSERSGSSSRRSGEPACLARPQALRPRCSLVPLLGFSCGINTIPTYQEQAKAKWSDIPDQHQRSADLIPNMVGRSSPSAHSAAGHLSQIVCTMTWS